MFHLLADVDLLSDILQSTRWKNHILAQKTLHGPWGFRFPCAQSGGFHAIARGGAVLRWEGKVIRLEKGDVVFVMKGVDHELASDAAQKAVDITSFTERRDRKTGPPVQLVSMRYEFPEGEIHPFFRELPGVLHIRSSELPVHHPLETTLALLARETAEQIGSSLILERLTDILLYYAIRHWLDAHPAKSPGFRSAMRDEKVQAALEMIHARPDHPWTLESMARSIGLSRASLASRFRAVLGSTPMDYVTDRRLDRGHRLLEEGRFNLEEIARQTGYSSAFAFSKAYKRVRGRSPRASVSEKKEKGMRG